MVIANIVVGVTICPESALKYGKKIIRKEKMRCKHCRKLIREDEKFKTIPLGLVHKDCFDDFIKKELKKAHDRRKKNKKEMKSFIRKNNKRKAKDLAWKYFSDKIRLRDSDKDGYCYCISCGARRYYRDFMDAGHFVPKSTGEYFYFNEDNVHAQCRDCNSFRGGKRDVYKEQLIKKIGAKKVEELERLEKERPLLKRTLEDYQVMAKKYRDDVKKLKKKKNGV